MKCSRLLLVGTAAIALGCLPGASCLAHAQYPGHVETQEKPAETAKLRSIAVLEWTGDRNHPNATRLVPISLFDGNHLQDGALYLARPVPLALDSGTEYEVESSGLPQGWFDVAGASQIGGNWIGIGKWKPYIPPPPKKLHPSHNPPVVVHEKNDADKPHFVRRDQTAQSSTTGSAGTASSDKDQSSGNAQASSVPVDPDRPRLRRRPEESAAAQPPPAAAPETPSAAPDPDRPRLSYGKPAELKNEPKPLEITPVAMGQTVAVSDASSVGTQSFAYAWASPEDAANAKKEMETQALQWLAGAAPAPPSPAAAKQATRRRPERHTKAKTAPPDPDSLLTDVRFSAFALTQDSGPTLVLTAHEASGTRSIAVIGLQDIYGKVHVLWHSMTDDEHLDVTPRIRLIDAVDPRGDGRANLLFEQRNATDRRFVLFVVGADSVDQVFATDPLPLHPVAQSSGD